MSRRGRVAPIAAAGVNLAPAATLVAGMPTVSSPPASPVVIRFGRLGDTVLLQPMLRRLHARYGQPCRLLALGHWPSELYSAQPEVAGCIALRTQSGPIWLHPQRWMVALALRGMREAPFYIAEPENRTATKIRPMLSLAGVPASHCTFIEDIPMRPGEHWVDWLLRFSDTTPAAFAAAAAAHERAPNAPQLQATAAEQADGAAWLRARGMHDRPLVLLQPGNMRTMRWNGVRRAADDDKSWPAERWAALARAIGYRLPRAQILLCGSPAEAGYLESLLGVIDRASLRIDAAALPLGRLKALLAMAHSMVSVDTGPAHLAAAMGCPLVVLMGGREPHLWTPRSGSGSAVQLLGGLPAVRRVDEIGTAEAVAAWRELPMRPARAHAETDEVAA